MFSVCRHSGVLHTLHACLPAGRLCLHALCLESRKQKQVLLQRIKLSSFVLPSPQTELTVPEDQSPFSFSFCPTESHCVIIQVVSAFTVLHCVTLEDKNTQTFGSFWQLYKKACRDVKDLGRFLLVNGTELQPGCHADWRSSCRWRGRGNTKIISALMDRAVEISIGQHRAASFRPYLSFEVFSLSLM